MSEKIGLHQLFAHSAQRLVLLDWLAQRAHFEAEAEIAGIFTRLRELEELQVMGHLDFLLKDAPLLRARLGDGEENLELVQKQIEQDLNRLLPDVQKMLLESNQHDAEDWLSAVVHQNQEMLRILRERKTAKHHSFLQQEPPSKGDVVEHFTERAERYDQSSHWCTDIELRQRVLSILEPKSTDTVLDVACGTGLVSEWFYRRVESITGVDITEAMYLQAKDRLDHFLVGQGESIPASDDQFDLVVSRQGIQFMDDSAAVKEMARVTKPGGRVCVINLCAYGQEDQEEYFEILRLRNPVRRNFYLREDLRKLFEQAGLKDIEIMDHISNENVDVWSNNGAISEDRREAIREIYRNASEGFLKHHHVRKGQASYMDKMLFAIVVGTKS